MGKSGNKKYAERIYPKDPEHILMPYLMRKRHEAEVYLQQDIDITELLKWLEEKNKTLEHKMTFFHTMVAIAGKTVYSRPLLNRFIKGKKFYKRNEVTISFVAKNKLSDDAEERLIVCTIDEDELPTDLSKRILNTINKSRSSKSDNDTGNLYKNISKIPSFILSIIFVIVRWLDKKCWLPNFLIENDFNFSTILFSNLGSIKCDSVYHHLNDYGTNSIVITIGTIHKVDGRDIVDLSLILDERIADGFYFAKSVKYIQHIASNPHLLDEKIGKTIKLPENKK